MNLETTNFGKEGDKKKWKNKKRRKLTKKRKFFVTDK